MKPIKKIICPVDVYDFQPEAAEYALTLGKALDAKIIVVYVMEPIPSRYVGGADVYMPFEYQKRMKQEDEAKLTEIIAEFASDCQINGEVVVGQAADKIIQVAEEHSADMIIMASHGRSFWGRTIHGSVTNKVLANTKIPVLVIYPQKEQ